MKKTIKLKEPDRWQDLDPTFYTSTDGSPVDFQTKVALAYDLNFLKVKFECLQNPFTLENTYREHNSPMYNQEVFEVFIGIGSDDSREYMEVEINPNNAIWVGWISNPDLGESPQTLVGQVPYKEANIHHRVALGENKWSGVLNIPWELIGAGPKGDFRINFYRIRAKISHSESDWACDAETCDFVCWSSTMSGKEPAFHRPKRFGLLQVNS